MDSDNPRGTYRRLRSFVKRSLMKELGPSTSLLLARDLYDLYIHQLIDDSGEPSGGRAEAIQNLALFAWECHTGYLRDSRLDKLLDELAEKYLISEIGSNTERDLEGGRMNILFISTSVHGIGGHTRMMRNFVKGDDRNDYQLLLTDQGVQIPSFLIEADGLEFISLDNDLDLMAKAQQLRGIIAEGDYDRIILNQHPHDVIPHLALSSLSIPVLYFNHADHVFWMGGGVTDVVLDFRKEGMRFTEDFRKLPSSFLTYQVEVERPELPRADMRRRLDIPYDKVLVSMASSYKYNPVADIDFIAEFSDYLRDRPDTGLYIIGMTEKEASKMSPQTEIPENLHLLGYIERPHPHIYAADIFIESYPMSSGLAMAEVLHLGVPIHFAYPINNSIYREGALTVFKLDGKRKRYTKSEYFQSLDEKLGSDSAYRASIEEFSEFIQDSSVGPWKERLHEILASVKRNKKRTYPAPVNELSEDDARWARFQHPDAKDVLHRFLGLMGASLTLDRKVELERICRKHFGSIRMREMKHILPSA